MFVARYKLTSDTLATLYISSGGRPSQPGSPAGQIDVVYLYLAASWTPRTMLWLILDLYISNHVPIWSDVPLGQSEVNPSRHGRVAQEIGTAKSGQAKELLE